MIGVPGEDVFVFTYHLVNIKLYGYAPSIRDIARFTYHLVNIKQFS
ncbi:hypothetical protein BN191_650077 [Clostridioides difficile T61]|nr:hypothetical protein BN169_590063 [Clostridioides difficile E16]CCL96795.1 hypothetical protein BN191_650077 [Clostridioides difficile T61]